MKLYSQLNNIVSESETEFGQIPEARKQLLERLAAYVRTKKEQGKPARLNFICTHNSRRSHLAQVWAQAAAAFYNVPDVHCYSGGTEATAFNPRAVKAMEEAGFRIRIIKEGENPLYEVRFADGAAPLQVWSKRFDDPASPVSEFCAVMTCSDADRNCPIVSGTELRLGLTFDDPKEFDGTPQEARGYMERVRQIGREILYAFSRV